MHLGLIVPSYHTVESMQIPSLSLLTTALSAKIQVTMIPLRNPSGPGTSLPGGIKILDPAGAGLRFRTMLRRAVTLIRNEHHVRPFDVLHAYWLFEPGAVAVVAGRLLRIPTVASIGGAELANLPGIGYGGMRTARGRLINRSVLQTASVITGGSNYVLGLARDATPGTSPKLRLAPLPVDGEVTKSETRVRRSSNTQRLLQVGAYLPVKGQDLSIRAMAALKGEFPNVSLTVIGEDPFGYRSRMRDLAQNLGFGASVQFLERVPHNELAAYYSNADLLLMPSRHESQGMVVLEAAAYGLPAVGTHVGVVGDLAPGAAASVAPDDHRCLASAVSRLLRDTCLRSELGAAARHIVAERYGMKPVVARWLDIYREAVHGD